METDKLSSGQEQQLRDHLCEQMVGVISFPEAVSIVSNAVREQVKTKLSEMSDEEKVKTYQDLNLK